MDFIRYAIILIYLTFVIYMTWKISNDKDKDRITKLEHKVEVLTELVKQNCNIVCFDENLKEEKNG